jgi:hypothetical protein
MAFHNPRLKKPPEYDDEIQVGDLPKSKPTNIKEPMTFKLAATSLAKFTLLILAVHFLSNFQRLGETHTYTVGSLMWGLLFYLPIIILAIVVLKKSKEQ